MKIKEVIVVEGKHDSEKLKKYFDVDTIETNGLGLNKQTIDLISELNKERGVIIFTDPDHPGEKIRRWINDKIPNLKQAFIDKKCCRTTKKVGIEHANYEDLKTSLEHVCTFDNNYQETITYEEFIDLGLQGGSDARKKRELLGELLFIGSCNAKTLFKRLNMLGINKEKINQLIEENYGKNNSNTITN